MSDLEPEPTDRRVVEDLHQDSSAALATLFDRYADAVYNYCFRRTASWDVAEDATSAVFLEAWRGRTRMISHNDSALPWLYGIANNVCRNAMRSQRRRSNALMRMLDERSAPDHADRVAQRLDSERRMAEVLDSIKTLPQTEQDVLALVVWSGLDYDSAAQALDVPVGTIRSRLSRARSRLALAIPDPIE